MIIIFALQIHPPISEFSRIYFMFFECFFLLQLWWIWGRHDYNLSHQIQPPILKIEILNFHDFLTKFTFFCYSCDRQINVSVHYIAKEPAFYMAGYFVFVKILLPGSIGQVAFWFGFFLIIFDQFDYKISGNSGEVAKQLTTQNKLKKKFKKIKEKKMTADRNEKIKARKKVTEMKKKNYTLLFDEKSF